jgi:hypothetical protein
MAIRIRVGLLVTAVVFAGVTGCGGGGNGGSDAGGGAAGAAGTTGAGGQGGAGAVPASSGVTGTKRLDALTTAEIAKICDWSAAHFGGYGQTVDCGDGSSLSSDSDQATCISMAPKSCALTVSQYETCVHDTSCSDPLPPSCAALLQCS